jgi:hypothetical protein
MADTTYYVYGIEKTNFTPASGTKKTETYRLMNTTTDQNQANAIATRLKLIFGGVVVKTSPQSGVPETNDVEPGHTI